MIITIDGPVATGKSSVAKRVAEQLGFIHFDTGAMYRCLTAYLQKHRVEYLLEEPLEKALKSFTFAIDLVEGVKRYRVDGEDVTDLIRGEAVTREVSHVSAVKKVRERLVSWQRAWGKKGQDAVFEGRDLGSVVFPEAELKIYLTGSDEIRAQRRFDEFVKKFPTKSFRLQEVLEDLKERDRLDMTREISPLMKPEGAIEIDTSYLTLDEVVEKIVEAAKRRREV